MEDYPAAHSMDTNWFAVDADGNVGYFSSGEGGAVPASNQIGEIEYFDELLAVMARNSPDRTLKLDVSSNIIAKNLTMKNLQEEIDDWLSFHASREQYNSHNESSDNLPSIYDVFLLLSSEEIIPLLGIESLKNKDAYILCFTGETTVVFVSHCHIATLQKLIEAKQVLGGRECDNSDYLASLLGFFSYGVGEQAPLPYKRRGNPINPLQLQDLSPYIRDKINWISFNQLKFAQNRQIQPIEHMPCHTWGNNKWWMDTKENEHNSHPHDPIQ